MDKVLSGEKTIESRWSKDRRSPFGNVNVGETIYFKYSSGPVTAMANVNSAIFFKGGDERSKVIDFVYVNYIALGFDDIGIAEAFLNDNEGRNYVTFISLSDIVPIKKFSINKKGFGVRASWIVVEDIQKIIKYHR
ncbi:hypothetical protein ACFL2E_06155, partial [Thermodesulfobacteriota bacterium]